MKHEKIGLKWKVFLFLLIFAFVLIVVLWLCQTVYLDKFYKFIKENELKNAVSSISGKLTSDNATELVETIAAKYDICIRITDQDFKDVASAENFPNCSIHSISATTLRSYYREAEANGGFLEYTNKDGGRYKIKQEIPQPYGNDDNQKNWREDKQPIELSEQIKKLEVTSGRRIMPESVVCVKLKEVNDNTWMILVNASLTPVGATVDTLRIQLIFISIIMIILALGMALFISKTVSKSIIKTNLSAKKLAKGEFDVVFEGKDYKEIAELSDTLNYAASELAKTENLQHELIANVSHDLRTPLTMIIAYSEAMKDLPGENTPENVQVVIDEAQRLTNLVNDMLDISKLQAGVMQLELKKYDLTESINSVMERYVKLMEQEGYHIRFEFDGHIFVEADEYKIYQVLYNLINNAVNYSGEEKAVCVSQIIKADKVRIEVADHGPGISAEELPFVWERYYKVDKTHKRAVKGTGLGLSIVKNILKAHQTEYGVESEPGKGSIFWFELNIVS